MKPISRIISRLMLVIMFASLLPGCSKAPPTSISGGSPVSSVQLEPEGLELLKPATLTITLPKGYDPRRMVSRVWFQ